MTTLSLLSKDECEAVVGGTLAGPTLAALVHKRLLEQGKTEHTTTIEAMFTTTHEPFCQLTNVDVVCVCIAPSDVRVDIINHRTHHFAPADAAPGLTVMLDRWWPVDFDGDTLWLVVLLKKSFL